MTQQSHSQAYTLRKPKLKEIHVFHCSLQYCLQQLEHGSSLDVHRVMNGWISCGASTQWNITQPLREMKLSYLQRHGWTQSVIQSEVSQKEKNKHRILMHVCGIQKNGIDDPICKAEVEAQTQRTNVWILRGEGGGKIWEIGIDTCILLILCIKQITNEKTLYCTSNST